MESLWSAQIDWNFPAAASLLHAKKRDFVGRFEITKCPANDFDQFTAFNFEIKALCCAVCNSMGKFLF